MSAAAWSALVIGPGGAASPSHGLHESIASASSGWALMVAAMMGPLVAAPLRHVYARSFARRRARAVVLFGSGYLAIWMAAGVMLLALTAAVRLVAPQSTLMLALGTLVALIWECSPLKQRCLNRCHARSELAAFGPAADADAICFGLTHGVWCAGSCWALMLLPLLVSRGHVAAMAAVALWLLAERLDRPMPPRWRVRGVGKAARLVMAQSADFSVRGATWPKSRLP